MIWPASSTFGFARICMYCLAILFRLNAFFEWEEGVSICMDNPGESKWDGNLVDSGFVGVGECCSSAASGAIHGLWVDVLGSMGSEVEGWWRKLSCWSRIARRGVLTHLLVQWLDGAWFSLVVSRSNLEFSSFLAWLGFDHLRMVQMWRGRLRGMGMGY